MPPNIQLWPEEVIELNRQLADGHYPGLREALEREIGPNYGHQDFFLERLGVIAAYCGIAIDGTFDSDQILAILRIITARLPQMRRREDDGKPEIIIPLH